MPKTPTCDQNITKRDHLASESVPFQVRVNPIKRIWQMLYSASPFGGNLALTIAGNILTGFFALITGPLLARLLGPSGRGELAAIQNLYWLTATLAMLGLPEATLFFTARAESDSRRILSSSILLSLISFPVFYICIYPLVPHMLAAQPPSVTACARLVLLGMPLYALALLPQYSLRGRNELVAWNVIRLLPNAGWVILLVFLPFIVRPSPSLFAFAYLGIFALAAPPSIAACIRRVPGRYKPQPELWPRMLRYGIPIAGSAIPIILNLRLDQMLMAAFVPPRSLGLYVVGVGWSATVPPLLVAIGTVLFPRVASAEPRLRAVFLAQGTRLGMTLALILALSIAIITPIAVPLLFGSAFRESIAVSVVLVFAAAISSVNVILEEGLRGLGEPSTVLWGEAAGLLFTAIVLAIFLRPLGIMGAGLASIIGYSATFGFLIAATARKIGKPLADLLILKSDDVALISLKIRGIRGM